MIVTSSTVLRHAPNSILRLPQPLVFFDANGTVLDIESSYVSDSDGEIKPGATETKDIWGPSSGYDHVEVYFTGYGKS